MAVIKTL